ncbi:MAG: hypothetical protein JXB10_00470 [Pirellulales bacterium]|nr:hypothetical protein [Pirellulales bacterium]
MYSTFLTTFILFGAVVNSPTAPTSSSDNRQQIAPPTTDNPLQKHSSQQPGSQSGPGYSSPLRQRDMMRLRQLNSMASRRDMLERSQLILPQPPTDNSNDVRSQIYQWLPPTVTPSSRRAGNRSTTTSGTMGGLSLIPDSPTQARPDLPRNYASRSTAEAQVRQIEAMRNAGPSNSPVARPYSGYQAPRSGVSPYMRLYSPGSIGADNYTTWVRPELQQQQANRAFGNEISSLQSSTHVQGLSLRRLGQETNSLRGVHATQYFMNYGDYYQGAR